VKKSYQKLHLGYEIIETLKAIGKEKKVYKIILDCSDDNIGFYEKCGLKRVGNEMAIYF